MSRISITHAKLGLPTTQEAIMMEFIGLMAAQHTLLKNHKRQSEDEFYRSYSESACPRTWRIFVMLKALFFKRREHKNPQEDFRHHDGERTG
jgi:hypothetical protein